MGCYNHAPLKIFSLKHQLENGNPLEKSSLYSNLQIGFPFKVGQPVKGTD